MYIVFEISSSMRSTFVEDNRFTDNETRVDDINAELEIIYMY
jgi:hypothetical protein